MGHMIILIVLTIVLVLTFALYLFYRHQRRLQRLRVVRTDRRVVPYVYFYMHYLFFLLFCCRNVKPSPAYTSFAFFRNAVQKANLSLAGDSPTSSRRYPAVSGWTMQTIRCPRPFPVPEMSERCFRKDAVRCSPQPSRSRRTSSLRRF